MKKLYLLLLSISMLSACSDDDKDPIENPNLNKVEVSAEMKYKVKDSYVADVGAMIFCFQGFYDYVNYSYIGDGKYKHNTTGEIVNATEKGTAGSDGVAKISVNYSYKSLIVWESKNVKGKYGQNVYDIKKDDPIKISQIYFSDSYQPTYP
uniref:hypothetical protein n=1 Tax=uncultured Dysgonomonas sp. TaxID=206096 RepID=UPI00262AE90D|nr:hypothetical protein [uncultured Dysgonomonas sp.]